mmetsp:Transcript_64290/g.127036  ORF Transcript_64290/g.127036 Transcript_64290/m.127036 type:complete len:217 (-) Transcript_64290:653-1303(-)
MYILEPKLGEQLGHLLWREAGPSWHHRHGEDALELSHADGTLVIIVPKLCRKSLIDQPILVFLQLEAISPLEEEGAELDEVDVAVAILIDVRKHPIHLLLAHWCPLTLQELPNLFSANAATAVDIELLERRLHFRLILELEHAILHRWQVWLQYLSKLKGGFVHVRRHTGGLIRRCTVTMLPPAHNGEQPSGKYIHYPKGARLRLRLRRRDIQAFI